MVAPKQPLDNHGSIRIRFTHNGIRFTLGSLGQYNDPIAVKHAQTICDRIALDIASGNFTATNNGELALKYNPNAITSFVKQASRGIQEAIADLPTEKKPTLVELLEARLDKKFCTPDKALLNLLHHYNKNIQTVVDAQHFVEWIKQTRGITNRTLKRYVDTLQVISPLFKSIKITVEAKPLPNHLLLKK